MRRYVLLGALLFVALLLWRLPLGWVTPWLPAGVQCAGASGSLWQGRCDTLSTPRLQLQSVAWHLHALPLLRGEASLSFESEDPAVQASEAHWHVGGQWRLHGVHARLPLPHPLLRMVPAGYSGDIVADLADIAGTQQRIDSAEGTIQVLNLHSTAALGSFEIKLARGDTAGDIAGELHDLAGPLQVEGTLRLRAPGYTLQGRASPRGAGGEDLDQALAWLGPPDSEGRRAFSVEGTF